MPTLQALVDEYIGQHVGEEDTKRALRERLKYATDAWGDLRIDRLNAREVGAWRARLPGALCLGDSQGATVRAQLRGQGRAPAEEPGRGGAEPGAEAARSSNLRVRRGPRGDCGGPLPALAPIPVFVGLTGLRPEEWLALERGDLDRRAGVLHIRRVFTDGQLKLYGKQDGSLRTVPLPLKAAQSLAQLPPRLDTPPDLSWGAWRQSQPKQAAP
jgi:integrase